MSFTLTFLGAAGTVTGSKYLLTCNDSKILVDCGLFQGVKTLRLKNWDDIEIKASEIQAIILTHAHIDHSGYIPRLIKNGFRGKIYCTQATKDLCRILLPDAGYLMEEEAEYRNRTKRTKHSPALPLYTLKEAEASLNYFEGVSYNQKIQIDSRISFEFFYAGHILGAASVVISVAGKKIAFSGDIGRLTDEIMNPPAPLPPVNYLVTESTYGNRLHEKVSVKDELAQIINETVKRKGVIIIPAFAVGRAQTIMYYVWKLLSQNKIPDIPMYLNSPMATNVNELLKKYKTLHKLTPEESVYICRVVKYVSSVEDSIALNEKKGPMLIISASGMLSGGRVLHHLKAFGPDPRNTIVLAGFQAAGTRGEALQRGVREIKVHGEYIDVRAEVRELDNISAHADYSEILEWLAKSDMSPEKVFITHGEPSAADELRRRITEKFGWNCVVPWQNDKVVLG
ncbi:MAG: MBL fold metallo-hydrolase [Pseudobdellovibrio sp.]|nr:MBL fold metallo-hydrolase [Pseudobdellovibrio sp.]